MSYDEHTVSPRHCNRHVHILGLQPLKPIPQVVIWRCSRDLQHTWTNRDSKFSTALSHFLFKLIQKSLDLDLKSSAGWCGREVSSVCYHHCHVAGTWNALMALFSSNQHHSCFIAHSKGGFKPDSPRPEMVLRSGVYMALSISLFHSETRALTGSQQPYIVVLLSSGEIYKIK